MLSDPNTKLKRGPGRPKGSGPTPASWKPGQTGNANGAPIRERTRIAHTLIAAADKHREALVEVVIRQALNGCQHSQRLVFERLGPAPVRAQTTPVAIEGIAYGSIEQRLEAVLKAASEGTISSDEAKVLIDGIRGATEAAALANLEHELEGLRQMRQQALTASQTHQEALQGVLTLEEAPKHE